MKNLAYYNGTYGPVEEMMIPAGDRGFYFGDGIYEATCVRNHKIFLLDEHVDRFFRSAEGIRMTVPYTKDELKAILSDLALKVDSPDQVCYWQMTRGTAKRGHAFPGSDVKPNLYVTLTPNVVRDTKKPMALTETEDNRWLFCHIKTLNLLLNVLANQKAKEEGCEECIFHRGDRVTEGSHSNVSILKDGVLRTAPLDHYILPGIARLHLIQAAEKLGVPVVEEAFTMDEMKAADEVIVTSSTLFCAKGSTLSGEPIGGKAPELYESLRALIMAEYEEKTN